FRATSKKIICSSLGESAGEAAIFLLREVMRRDPFEVLWENPRAFYEEIVKVFGEGAKVLINVLIENINREYGLTMRPEHFLELMREGDRKALEEIRSFIRMVAKASKEA
ncbi:MAG: hypothetical protein QXT26_02935, partial [Thermoproteota archaeon]